VFEKHFVLVTEAAVAVVVCIESSAVEMVALEATHLYEAVLVGITFLPTSLNYS
jgi:hypothetical protein